MNYIQFLESQETLNKVLTILENNGLTYDKLPKGSFISGGSVSNVLISLVHGGVAKINDIDVYHKIDKHDVNFNNWYPSMFVQEDGLEMMDDDYGRIFVGESGDCMSVVSHRRIGILNIIQYAYRKGPKHKENGKTEMDVVIEGFDLNCCMSGIDLENRKIVYNQHFVDYLKSKQLKVVNPLAPLQTTIRIYKKIQDLDCYCNIEHEMRYLTVATKHLTNGQLCRWVGVETEVKYRKYEHFVSKYFKLREPQNSDEIPYQLRDKYYIGNKRNPDCKIWLYEPQLDFDIIDNVGSVNHLRRIWYLMYTTKRGSEQDKINKIYYKNAFLGKMNEDSWDRKEGHPIAITLPYYNSNRFTYHMILSKKDYYKCDFTLKHVDEIDTLAHRHYFIRHFLKNIDKISEQYKIVKFIKSLVKKEGEWVIGILENVDRNVFDMYSGHKITEEFILKFIEGEKDKELKDLIQPIDLSSFQYRNNVKELTSNLQLKEEGTKMGHCVGGYGRSLERGDSRIFHIECNGIGSTLELRNANLYRKNQYSFLDDLTEKVKISSIEYLNDAETASGNVRFRVDYEDKTRQICKITDIGYSVRQHHGRYPEKGNLTPTQGNKEIVEELTIYLNKKFFFDNFNIDLESTLPIDKENLSLCN